MEDTSGQRGPFNIVNRITIYDNHGENSQSRDVLIVECLGERIAFYKSTGTSNSTSWSKNTYFPFYGIKRFLSEPNHFIKASEIKIGGYLDVPKWKTGLKNAPYLLPREVLNYFDSFVELQASAWLNSGWWLSPIGQRSHAKILKLTWDDENKIYQDLHAPIQTLTEQELAGVNLVETFYLDVEGVKDSINAFLSKNDAKMCISKVIINNERVDRSEEQLAADDDDQNDAVIINPQDSPSPKKTKQVVGGKKRRTKRKKHYKKVKTMKKKTTTNRKSRRR